MRFFGELLRRERDMFLQRGPGGQEQRKRRQQCCGLLATNGGCYSSFALHLTPFHGAAGERRRRTEEEEDGQTATRR